MQTLCVIILDFPLDEVQRRLRVGTTVVSLVKYGTLDEDTKLLARSVKDRVSERVDYGFKSAYSQILQRSAVGSTLVMREECRRVDDVLVDDPHRSKVIFEAVTTTSAQVTLSEVSFHIPMSDDHRLRSHKRAQRFPRAADIQRGSLEIRHGET
jgi:hypothetical protein